MSGASTTTEALRAELAELSARDMATLLVAWSRAEVLTTPCQGCMETGASTRRIGAQVLVGGLPFALAFDLCWRCFTDGRVTGRLIRERLREYKRSAP